MEKLKKRGLVLTAKQLSKKIANCKSNIAKKVNPAETGK